MFPNIKSELPLIKNPLGAKELFGDVHLYFSCSIRLLKSNGRS